MGSSISIIENLNLTCVLPFFKKKRKQGINNLMDESHNYNLHILPISSDYILQNLYPITDRVNEWNTFIVGNDKTYILSNVCDNKYLNFTTENTEIVDTRGHKLPIEIFEFFDKIWTITLKGENLQFYMVVKSVLYFINTYSLKNTNDKIIGAILFMRNFDTLPKSNSDI